jgi:hypothetical protein
MDEFTSLNEKKEKALKNLEIAKKKAEIRDIEAQYKILPHLKKQMLESKTFFLVAFIFLNLVVVEIFSMWAIATLKDVSPLGGLIAAVVGEGFIFAIYCAKSFNSKKAEVASELERAKFEFDRSKIMDEMNDIDDNAAG